MKNYCRTPYMTLLVLLCCLSSVSARLSLSSAFRRKIDIYEYEDDHTHSTFANFFLACSQGDTESVKAILEVHHEYLDNYSESGETCLHVAAILGQSGVTKIALDVGADPNARSTFEGGHRFTPLAVNVFNGNVDTARLLLENKATDINLDVDSMIEKEKLVTVLDIAYDALPDGHLDVDHVPETDNYRRKKLYIMKELLLSYGAKTYSELDGAEDL